MWTTFERTRTYFPEISLIWDVPIRARLVVDAGETLVPWGIFGKTWISSPELSLIQIVPMLGLLFGGAAGTTPEVWGIFGRFLTPIVSDAVAQASMFFSDQSTPNRPSSIPSYSLIFSNVLNAHLRGSLTAWLSPCYLKIFWDVCAHGALSASCLLVRVMLEGTWIPYWLIS